LNIGLQNHCAVFGYDIFNSRCTIGIMGRNGIAGPYGFEMLATHSLPKIILGMHASVLQMYYSIH